MPETYDNEMKGVLFQNSKKERETQPDYRGDITIDGKEYWLSGWRRESKSGLKYMSLAATAKKDDPRPKESQPKLHPAIDGLDNDIPF